MKIDFDSILYIVITLAILVIGALGSRRKKRLQNMQAPPSPGSETDLSEPVKTGSPFTDLIKGQEQAVSADPYGEGRPNPLERLEQFLTGQEPQYASMEGESLETIIDEEEQILEEIHEESMEAEPEIPQQQSDIEPIKSAKPEKNALGLFNDVDEIKKAIIYGEILRRKYK